MSGGWKVALGGNAELLIAGNDVESGEKGEKGEKGGDIA
jgi:hypothetical protein